MGRMASTTTAYLKALEEKPRGYRFDDDTETIPVHWMGVNRVEMALVPREDVEPSREKGKKGLLQLRERERNQWKRLAREGEKLIKEDQGPAYQPDTDPDPIRDAEYRAKILSKLRPPPRITASGELTHEARRSSKATLYPESEASASEKASAANLISSLFRGESTRQGLKALCPFSGVQVPIAELEGHMYEWRAMMRAELVSLRLDPHFGPKIGLFVVPEFPARAPPREGASRDDVISWTDYATELLKMGYVLCRMDNRRYHWTELRKCIDSMPSNPRPWERDGAPPPPSPPAVNRSRRRSLQLAQE
ncbi:hypothetical protein DIPPA_19756 [Diplonema papillatum]|nr:hypothetical protein DIPPA_19756 [Diplonema papillatum]